MTYSVKIKRSGSIFWRKFERVKGDLIAPDMPGFRILILEDESRVEIPLEGTEFIFCSKRFLAIKQKMESEAGQVLPVKR